MSTSCPAKDAVGGHVPLESIPCTKTIAVSAQESLPLPVSFATNSGVPVIYVFVAPVAIVARPNVGFLVFDGGKLGLAFWALVLVIGTNFVVGIGRMRFTDRLRQTFLEKETHH